MVLFSPFRTHVSKYGSYEANLLGAELTGSTPISKDIIDELRNVSLSVQRLVATFTEASKRCCDLTEGREGKKDLKNCLDISTKKISQTERMYF